LGGREKKRICPNRLAARKKVSVLTKKGGGGGNQKLMLFKGKRGGEKKKTLHTIENQHNNGLGEKKV